MKTLNFYQLRILLLSIIFSSLAFTIDAQINYRSNGFLTFGNTSTYHDGTKNYDLTLRGNIWINGPTSGHFLQIDTNSAATRIASHYNQVVFYNSGTSTINASYLASELKNENIYVAPVLGTNNQDYISTSDFFSRKIKSSEESQLLKEIAAEFSAEIIKEVEYMPNWYLLRSPTTSHGLAMSNLFYETGMFEEVDPAFMFDFKPSLCTTEPNEVVQWGLEKVNACSAVAALMLSINPNLTGSEVVRIIENTAQKVGGYSYVTTSGRTNGTWNNEMGYGLLNAFAAVSQVSGGIVNFIDQTVTSNRSVSGWEIYARNFTVTNNSLLSFNFVNQITIDPPFIVNSGSTMNISY